jgi:hypothetical protein
MGDEFLGGVSAENREGAGVKAGDEVDVAPLESQCLADPEAGGAQEHPERMPAGVAAALEEDLQLSR